MVTTKTYDSEDAIVILSLAYGQAAQLSWTAFPVESILLFTSFFPVTFARQCCFHALFFTGLKVEGMPLYFLNDVLCLDFSLEAAKGVL